MDEKKLYLSLLAEEYKSLRDESRQISVNMFTALQWMTAIIGVITAAAFTQWNKQHAVVLLTFYIIIPVISGMSMFLWLREAIRFKRVGDYICFIEQKAGIVLDEYKAKSKIKEKWKMLQIEKKLSLNESNLDMSDPLVWEQWLKDMSGKSIVEGHLKWLYFITFSFFYLIAFFSIIIATYYAFTLPKCITDYNNYKIIIVILLLTSIIFFIFMLVLGFIFAKRLVVKTQPIIRI